MTEINSGIVFLAGLTGLFTPIGILFLGSIVALTISAIKTKKQILLIISLIIILAIFIISYNTMIVFPIGSILGTTISDANNTMMTIFLLGGIIIPLGITLSGFLKIK